MTDQAHAAPPRPGGLDQLGARFAPLIIGAAAAIVSGGAELLKRRNAELERQLDELAAKHAEHLGAVQLAAYDHGRDDERAGNPDAYADRRPAAPCFPCAGVDPAGADIDQGADVGAGADAGPADLPG